MSQIYESDIEEMVIDLLKEQGYTYLSREQQELERTSFSEVILKTRLKKAIDKLNPRIGKSEKHQALQEVMHLPNQILIENNESFHKMLIDGINVEYQKGNDTIGRRVWLIDFDDPLKNDFIVCNQFTVTQHKTRRPDVVLLVNGLPLVVMELKDPTDEKATVHKAFTQLQNYKTAIPSLFEYNGLLVASDGLDAKVGSLTALWNRFMAWKTVDGVRKAQATIPQIETLIKGMLRQDVLLDLIKHFSVFEKASVQKHNGLTSIETIKKIASDHQYYMVNKAVECTQTASSENGNRKIGVVWHTQGSGKSLSMVFYTGKVVLSLNNPTIVVITDRNDLDGQLFDTFASCRQMLRQEPQQAQDREHLKTLLKRASGGIIFTTIQKFLPEDNRNVFDKLSDRKNIVVIADESHRSQYGFAAKTLMKEEGASTKYGFAKYLRDALPNASFIGFTGTPIEREDISTRNVFGDYIDIYDMKQACLDGATVPIHYESRLVDLHLNEAEQVDAEIEEVTEYEESTASQRAKTRWTRLEAIIGHENRLKTVAQDIVKHFTQRCEVLEGKGMIVVMSRRIAVALYDEMIKLQPDWHDDDQQKGKIKVIMTSSSSDPENWQPHRTTKYDRAALATRFKDPQDPLRLVIVRDMWLTGFDVPCLHTMYIDKLMRDHNVMQTIARVNRVYKDKPGGLIVDYVGIAANLRKALAIYQDSGGEGQPTLKQSEAIATMMEKYEIIIQMFHGFDYKKYFVANTRKKMVLILEAQEHILSLDDGKERFIKNVVLLSKAFALSVPSLQAMKIKDEVAFFQAIKARFIKFEPEGSGKSDLEIETAIRQIIDKAIVIEGVVDIFDVAGIKKPDISVLSDEFLEEVRGMKRKNLALELLKKIINDEIRIRTKRNFIQNKKLSEMLKVAINKYKNNLLTAVQVIEELIKIAKEIRKSNQRGEDLGLTEAETAFYDALVLNESARKVLTDPILRDLACVLVKKVRENAQIDWTIKQTLQAKLRVIVKRTLREYGYPPDQEKLATDNILKQAELFASQWSVTDTKSF